MEKREPGASLRGAKLAPFDNGLLRRGGLRLRYSKDRGVRIDPNQKDSPAIFSDRDSDVVDISELIHCLDCSATVRAN